MNARKSNILASYPGYHFIFPPIAMEKSNLFHGCENLKREAWVPRLVIINFMNALHMSFHKQIYKMELNT